MPVFPADAATQTELAEKVDELLQHHATLNAYRAQDYIIRNKLNGTREIIVAYDVLLREMQQGDPNFSAYNLFEARAAALLALPDNCDPDAQISRVFTPTRYPNTVVLRANALWLTCNDEPIRRYLLNYLARPQWKNRSWNEIAFEALLPDPTTSALDDFYKREAARIAAITATLDAIAATDLAIDNRILDLYGVTAPADRARILGSAPPRRRRGG